MKAILVCLTILFIITACDQATKSDPSGPSKQNKSIANILAEKFDADDWPFSQIISEIHTDLDAETDSIFTYINGPVYKRQVLVFWKSGNISKSLYYKTGSQEANGTTIETFELVSTDTNRIEQPGLFAELADARNKMSAPLKPRKGIPDMPVPLYFIFDFKDSTNVFKFESDQLAVNTDHIAAALYLRISSSGLLPYNPAY